MRAALLVLAVAVTSGALLASAILLQGLQAGLERGLARLGADLMVVARGALANPQPSLLTGESGQPPLAADVPARLEALPGVARAAPQRVLRFRDPDVCGPAQAELIAFDPVRDFTVMSWIEPDHLERPFREGDVIVGSRLPQQPGESFMNYTVWGRLSASGVGTHERGLYVSREAIPEEALAPDQPDPERASAVLLRLSPGFSAESLRFAIGADPGLRVIEGSQTVSGVRQSLVALLRGMLALTALMLVLTALLIGVVFSAVVTERRRELGLLAAVGMSRAGVVALVALEAGMATFLGGLLGALTALGLLRLAQHTLLYTLSSMGVAYEWPPLPVLGLTIGAGVGFCLLIGLAGGALPAWGLARRETHELVRSEC